MSHDPDSNRRSNAWIDLLQEQVASLRYGVVQVVVHDRRVVLIERTEKFRLEKDSQRPKSRPE
jgi:hypothetical protein